METVAGNPYPRGLAVAGLSHPDSTFPKGCRSLVVEAPYQGPTDSAVGGGGLGRVHLQVRLVGLTQRPVGALRSLDNQSTLRHLVVIWQCVLRMPPRAAGFGLWQTTPPIAWLH